MKGLHLKILKTYASEVPDFNAPEPTPALDDVCGQFDVSMTEAAVFAAVLVMEFREGTTVNMHDLALGREGAGQYSAMEVLLRLTERGLLMMEDMPRRRRRSMVNGEFFVNPDVLKAMITGKGTDMMVDYDNAYSVIERASTLVERFEDDQVDVKQMNVELRRLNDNITEKNPLYIITKGLNFDHTRAVFYGAVVDHIARNGRVTLDDCLEYCSDSLSRRMMYAHQVIRQVMQRKYSLVQSGWLDIDPGEGFATDARVSLTPKLMTLLSGTKGKRQKIESSVLKHTLYRPSAKHPELFFGGAFADEMALLERAMSPKTFRQTAVRLKKAGMPEGITCLFYGAPGTGKTAAAYMLAHRTKRDVLAVDIPAIRDMWVGMSERNLKRVFSDYRNIAGELKRPPVLLFNEADALLGRRVEASGSVDVMNNAMQNILLEELETFAGILVATTNLHENMDDAFARRFTHKLGFEKPDAVLRARMWAAKMPMLDEASCARLARLDLSGAQVELVCRNAVREEALTGEPVDMERLLELTKRETGYGRKETPVGFVGS